MNDRWLVIAFRPAAGEEYLFDFDGVIFSQPESQGRGLVIGIVAASCQHGLHGFDGVR
jgi:hypothetical protein